jgi:hypothetical protein
MTTPYQSAFWIDQDYDREYASDGVSRFGHYVRDAAAGPRDIFTGCFDDGYWEDPAAGQAHFAAAAWTIATGPVMSPGYIRMHPRVLRASVHVSNWDGTLAGTADLAVPWPAPLARSRTWQAAGWWGDWEQQSLIGAAPYFRGPDEQEAAARPYLLTTATLAFPLPLHAGVLPLAPAGPRDGLVPAAQAAVAMLVRAMNAIVSPVITAVEEG